MELLRVAIVGSGPSAFYAAGALLGHPASSGFEVAVDMYDRLPTPFGLVRGGVAPDHQDIKRVVAQYDKIAESERFRFFGNVELGRDLSADELRRSYHQVVYATGAETDRRMGVPGEDLRGSHSATEFVAWYNGRPDYRDRRFDLSAERVVVIGVGNVAVDVCRILSRTEQELRETDIADHALSALAGSRVREVIMIGRRGPAQAAFTTPELRELGELAGADLLIDPAEAELDELTREHLAAHPDRAVSKKLEVMKTLAAAPRKGHARRLVLRFFLSPVELVDDGAGRVAGVQVERTRFVRGAGGGMELHGTGERELLPAGLVFRSIGYKGIALPGVPFDEKRGLIPNADGRVQDGHGATRFGEYVVGWIKRGPTGIIGTNKPDARETVERMLADFAAGVHLEPPSDSAALLQILRDRGARPVTWQDWRRLDQRELDDGARAGRPRVKLCTFEALMGALGPHAGTNLE